MSKAPPPEYEASHDETGSEPAPAVRRPGMFDDPLVRKMAYVATFLVVVFLATVVSALISGVLLPSGPRTALEQQLVVSSARVEQGSTDPAHWNEYITALVAVGQHARARTVIEDARASVEDSITADISIGETRLYRALGDHERALEIAEAAMEQIMQVYEERIAAQGPDARVAAADGIPENYYVAALIRAMIYSDLEQWENAIAMYDIFIEGNQGAADIRVDRGIAKAESGDTEGAEADFRRALEFNPYSKEAQAALERIGVTP